MEIAVFGLWHLGSVISACLAGAGHNVVGLDNDLQSVEKLCTGKAPLYETGLNDLIQHGLNNGNLRFREVSQEALKNIKIVWVAFDTPVDEDDVADIQFVLNQIKLMLPLVSRNTLILISSQLPVGSVEYLEKYAKLNVPELCIRFACSPENLRLGKAIQIFNDPDRIILGIRSVEDKNILIELMKPITESILWMSIESAEMTKHAINAFLATSITFTNEIATICESVGANAKEVELGLRSEMRIGNRAYVSPGGAFAGGTLARDVDFLNKLKDKHNLTTPVLSSIRTSNDNHKQWFKRKLIKHFTNIKGKTIGVWGLTYKPGTDTLRRSLSVEICEWVLNQGGRINVYDPVVKELPKHWSRSVDLSSSANDVLQTSDALIIGTEWPDFKNVMIDHKNLSKKDFPVFDANCFLKETLNKFASKYYSVGIPVF